MFFLIRKDSSKTNPNEKKRHYWSFEQQDLPKELFYTFKIIVDEQETIVSDPYAKEFLRSTAWGRIEDSPLLSSLTLSAFSFGKVTKPNIPLEDLVIYEMHIKGFTEQLSSKQSPFIKLINKIDYFLDLGINALELLPIFIFDEKNTPFSFPKGTNDLYNYWGLQPY